MSELGRTLLILGLVLAACGLVLLAIGRFGLTRLPGDIVVRRPGFTFAFPLATSLILSGVLSLLLNLFLRRR